MPCAAIRSGATGFHGTSSCLPCAGTAGFRSYQDISDLLAEGGIMVDRVPVFRWVWKFGPEIAGRAYAHRSWRGLNWHVDGPRSPRWSATSSASG